MNDTISLHLSNADKTTVFGNSIAKTLYERPLDILWEGQVGAGKSTAIRAFFLALGVEEHVTSPTFALEQHYRSSNGTPLLHIDLYRMEPKEAAEFLRHTDGHDGIRCIEWAERAGRTEAPLPRITIRMAEEGDGRLAELRFDDARIPDDAAIDAWRADVALPALVGRHCDMVAHVAMLCADDLLRRGIAVRRSTLRSAARLHDLLRFVDFKPELWAQETPEAQETWKQWMHRYPGHHEEACAALLRERGFGTVAAIVEPHGLRLPSPDRQTVEQQILYYADKRVAFDTVVTLEERFADFRKRYGPGREEEAKLWYSEACSVEAQLFPDGPPAP